jgi:TPP-dependent trihydroxycyclohexane-1,2-dione (THcHDO) dehydratase
MLGMHGTVAANYAVDRADLLLALGVRFDDRVTGKLEAFAARARIVHVDIDPAEINKNKASHVTVCADARPSLKVRACCPRFGAHAHSHCMQPSCSLMGEVCRCGCMSLLQGKHTSVVKVLCCSIC